ncbi:Mitochondrial beta-keto-acyl synthase [Xylographa bjoerkii]|nr:Mitochondrial beta-keto-acyl synthase [Xylographa bjoerkii]
MAKFMQYTVVATKEALDDAGWRPGVCLDSGIGAFEDVYNTSVAFDKLVRILFCLGGPNHAATTACTTGTHSIGDASRFIAFGDADVMVAGRAESCIHPLAITGFERSRSLVTSSNQEPSKASRPFSQDRNGFVIGEGAGIMILEELNHALSRKAHIYAHLSSYATIADAHHLTQPPVSGHGAFRSLRRALAAAQIPPSRVSYLNAHATSTPLGDSAETKAMMLGEDGVGREQQVCVSSTKGATGHLLGAATASQKWPSTLCFQIRHASNTPPGAKDEAWVLDPSTLLRHRRGSSRLLVAMVWSCAQAMVEATKRKVSILRMDGISAGDSTGTLIPPFVDLPSITVIEEST